MKVRHSLTNNEKYKWLWRQFHRLRKCFPFVMTSSLVPCRTKIVRISGYVKLAVWLSAAEIIFRIKGKFLRMKALQKCTTFSSMNKGLRLRIGQGSGTEFSFGFVDDEMKKSLISISRCRSTMVKSWNFSSPFLEKVCLKKKRKKFAVEIFVINNSKSLFPQNTKISPVLKITLPLNFLPSCKCRKLSKSRLHIYIHSSTARMKGML